MFEDSLVESAHKIKSKSRYWSLLSLLLNLALLIALIVWPLLNPLALPKNAIRVAESGIDSGADIARLRSAGYDAFLIGESLMKATQPGAALRTLLAQAAMPVPG